MPGGSDFGAQSEIMEQLTELLKGQQQHLQGINSALGEQVALMQELCKLSAECYDTEKRQEFNDIIEEGQDQIRRTTDETTRLTEEMRRATDEQERSGAAIDKLTGGFGKVVDVVGTGVVAIGSMNKALAMVKSAAAAATGGLSLITGTLGSLITAASGTMSALWGWANASGGGGGAMKEAIDGVREEFGRLESGEGAAVMEMYEGIKDTQNDLAAGGTRLKAVIGKNADVLKYATEMAKSMGNSFGALKDQLVGAAGEMMMLNKGMNLSNEAMKTMAINAKASGKDLKTMATETAQMTVGMAKSMGVSVKAIGKNMSELGKDFETFGHLSQKEMIATAGYAAKLGVSIKSLKGMMDKFDSFEGAAESAGKLNEVMGMNIDTMAMMNAESPAERMDMLRKSFEETGKSVSDLSRHELKAMADAAGTTAEDLKMALSTSTDEVSFDEFAEAAEEAKEEVSPAEAMQELAKEMKKFNKGGGGGGAGGGPFAQFIAGMKKGIAMSKPFRELKREIKKFLKVFFKGGVQVGKILGRIMGRAGGLMDAFKSLFEIKPVKKFMKAVVKAFSIFEVALGEGKSFSEAFTELLGNLWNAVDEYWATLKPKFAILWTKIKDFAYNAIVQIGDLLPKAVSFLAKGISAFADGLTKAFATDVGKAAKGAGGNRFVKALSEAWDKLWPVLKNELFPALLKLGGVLFKEAGPALGKLFLFGVLWLLKDVILGFFLKTIIGGTLKTVGKALGKAVGKMMGKDGIMKGASTGLKASKAFFATNAGKLVGRASIVTAALATAMEASKTYETLGPEMQKKFGDQKGAVAAGAASILDAVTLGLLPDSFITDVGDFFGKALGKIEELMNKLGLGGVFRMWQDQLSGFTKIFMGVGDILRGLFGMLTGEEGAHEKVTQGLKKLMDGALDLVMAKIRWFTDALPDLAILALKGILTGLGWLLKAIFIWIPKAQIALIKKLVELGKQLFIAVKNFITDPAYRKKIIQKVKDFASNIVQGFIDKLKGFIDWVKNWASDLITSFKEAWGISSPSSVAGDLGTSIWDGIVNVIMYIPDKFMEFATSAWEKFTAVFDVVSEWAGGMWDKIKCVIQKIPDTFKNIACTAWDLFTWPYKAAFTFFSSFYTIIWDAVKVIPEKFKEIANLAWDFLTGAISPEKALQMGTDIVDGILEGIGDLAGKLGDLAEGAWDSVTSAFEIFSPSRKAAKAGSQITDGMTSGMDDMADKMGAIAETAMNMMQAAMQQAMGSIINVFVGLVQEIGRTFQQMAAMLQPTIVEALSVIPGAMKEALMASYKIVQVFGEYVAEAFGRFVQVWSGPLAGLTDALKNAFVGGLQAMQAVSLPMMGILANTLGTMLDMVTQWTSEVGGKMLSQIPMHFYDLSKIIMELLASMLQTVFKMVVTVFAPTMTKIMATITETIVGVVKMVTVGGLGVLKDVLARIVSPQIQRAPAISGVMESMREVTAIALGTRTIMEDILGQVDDAMEAIAVTQRIMSGDVKLKAVNKVLTGQKNVVVQTKAVNISLDVSVTMDSKRLGKALDVAADGRPWYPKPTYRGGSSIEGSDIRLKNNIKRLGKSKSGLNVYTFSYKNDPESRQYVGVMAQELLYKVPEAVVQNKDGYYAVDYSKIDVDFREVNK